MSSQELLHHLSVIFLNNKVAPFTVEEHIDSVICFCPNLVPRSGKTNLVPGSKSINFIEPKTSK